MTNRRKYIGVFWLFNVYDAIKTAKTKLINKMVNKRMEEYMKNGEGKNSLWKWIPVSGLRGIFVVLEAKNE